MNKKVYFLKKFSNTYGVSIKQVKKSGQKFGLNVFNTNFKLKKKNNIGIIKNFNVDEYDKGLKLQVQKNIKFLHKIKSYRGVRHSLKLPSRGQRTKTNARTKKRFKF